MSIFSKEKSGVGERCVGFAHLADLEYALADDHNHDH
jgi:hypothetical protein